MIEFVLNFIQSKVHKFYNYHQKKEKMMWTIPSYQPFRPVAYNNNNVKLFRKITKQIKL